MADIVNSLFGLSPQDIRAEKLAANRERSLGLGQLAPQGWGAAVAGAGDIGFAVGEGLGSLFGMQDPTLTKAKNIENVLFSVQDELGPDAVGDPTKLYPLLAERLNEAGLSREATKVSLMGTDEIAKFQKTQAEINKLKANQDSTKRSNLYRAKQELREAEDRLALDPNNPMLQKDVNEFQAAVDKLITDSLSTDKLLANAMTVISNPESTPTDILKAQNTLNTHTAFKMGEGMYFDAAEQRFKVLPGSPEARKILNDFNVKAAQAAEGLFKVDTINGNIDKAINLVSPKTTGIVGTGSAKLPGTEAFQLQEAIKQVIANIGFDRLQKMRDQSKTGGALGQVAVRELEMLQATIESLDLGLDEETLKANLLTVKDQYSRAVREYNKYISAYNKFLEEGGDPNNPPEVLTGEENTLKASVEAAGIDYEPDLYDYRIDPNGNVQRRKK